MSRSNALFLQAHAYELIETSMCTGDIVLYNDGTPDTALSTWCAESLTQLMAMMPCTTDIVTAWSSPDAADDDGSLEATPERQWSHWEHAVLVVSMIDETETNPTITRDEKKHIPYVFHVRPGVLSYELIPLKTLLAEVMARTGACYFALRQLMTRADRHHENQRWCSQLRNSLRTQIITFYRDVQAIEMEESKAHDAGKLASRRRDVTTAINDLVPRAAPLVATSQGMAQRHRLTLFRASPAYFALFTLYRISVLRVEPGVSTAIALLQEGGLASTQMSSDYFLTDEVVFHYTRGK